MPDQLSFGCRGWCIKFATGLNINYSSTSIKVTKLSFCQNDPPWVNHFGKRTVWSLMYFLINAHYSILPSRKFYAPPSRNSKSDRCSNFLLVIYKEKPYTLISLINVESHLLILKQRHPPRLFQPPRILILQLLHTPQHLFQPPWLLESWEYLNKQS